MTSTSTMRSGTVPTCGLQYTTSPSLPGAVKAAREALSKASPLFLAPSVLPQSDAGPLAHGTLQLYDTYYRSLCGTEPIPQNASGAGKDARVVQNDSGVGGSLPLPDDLSSIGPSARRLLQMEAEQQKQQEDELRGMKTKHRRSKQVSRLPVVFPVASRTLPTRNPRGRAAAASPRPARGIGDEMAAGASLPKSFQSSLKGAARHYFPQATGSATDTVGSTINHLARSLDVRPPMLPSSITNTVHSSGDFASTVPATATLPPLVTQLQMYIKHELILNSGGAAIPSAMDQLNPYREAFRALSSAFPAYASLFDDIQTAYDNVIQAQAELLVEAYSAAMTRNVENLTEHDSAAVLREQVRELQRELAALREDFASRDHSDGEVSPAVTQRPRTGRANETLELRRELEAAAQRITEMEGNSERDLEKIMVLIGAVRESDRRLKEYERLVTSVTGQVSELDEFKRIAGEAQVELQQFRSKYADYVPVADFRLMKEYLSAELEKAQLLTRRWRRTAAVRGTQLDVMQRRLTSIEEDRANMIEAAATSTSADPEATRAVLTPRPSWKQLYASYPELEDYAADLGPLTTDLDRDDDLLDVMEVENRSTAKKAKSSSFISKLPTVKGPTETALQVEYLVQRVVMAENELRRQRQQQRQQLLPLTNVASAGERGASACAPRSRRSSPAINSFVKTDAVNSSQRPTSHRSPVHGDGGRLSSAQAVGAPVVRLGPPLDLPLIGLGYGPHVPVYLRASGILSRIPVPPSIVVSIAYQFFLEVLPDLMEQEDAAQSAGEGDGVRPASPEALAPAFYELLKSEMQVHEDLAEYESVGHLMMNLERDGEEQEWCTDALHLLLWVLQGIMPPRVAVDAAVVVAQAKRDLRALAKEQQNSRLRRQAVGECLQPVLELKSPSEVAELRLALGGETTFNADTLCSDSNPFMQVLLVQECRAGANLYIAFLRALTARTSIISANEARAAASASAAATAATATIQKGSREAKPQPPPQLAEGDRVLTLEDISSAILEVEPNTPEVVIRELSLNSVSSAVTLPSRGHQGTESTTITTSDVASRSGLATDEAPIVVRLSDMVRVVGAAPLIRRTVQSAKEDCAL